mgnify:CR=1
SYTTASIFNDYGYLINQVTEGESYNKIFDGTSYIEYTVGTYQTTATSIDGFGTVKESLTTGESVRLDSSGLEMR